jgi:MoaA/NifB/PqqE/SkfB family radical SAM enzyme
MKLIEKVFKPFRYYKKRFKRVVFVEFLTMGIYSKIKQGTQKIILKKVLYTLSDMSNKNLIRAANFFEKIIPKEKSYKSSLKAIKKAVEHNHPTINFIKRIVRDMDLNCRDKFATNFIIKGLILNHKKRSQIEDQGSFVPYSVLISPTMRCNLDCVGCYANSYSKKDDMSFELFDRIVSEGEEMGAVIFTILGGEPLIAKDILFKICEKHKNAYFQFFTNGTLITKEVAEEIRELGNLLPIISIEGSEKQTDERRGKEIYKKVLKAMKHLKEKNVPFGYSVTVTSKNAEIVSSDKFVSKLIKRGAFIGWHFLYMPVGENPDVKLMPTPKQRLLLLQRWKKIRNKKPIFIIDFWNDAPFVGGCIAGKYYVHITPKGDVEPCIFSHFAVDNIKDKHLLEIMKSGFFKELRKRQPYCDNLYMPCMWIDKPEVAREVCKSFGCYPTHPGADTIIQDPKIKKFLDDYSKEVKKLFDPEWELIKHKRQRQKQEQEKQIAVR